MPHEFETKPKVGYEAYKGGVWVHHNTNRKLKRCWLNNGIFLMAIGFGFAAVVAAAAIPVFGKGVSNIAETVVNFEPLQH